MACQDALTFTQFFISTLILGHSLTQVNFTFDIILASFPCCPTLRGHRLAKSTWTLSQRKPQGGTMTPQKRPWKWDEMLLMLVCS